MIIDSKCHISSVHDHICRHMYLITTKTRENSYSNIAIRSLYKPRGPSILTVSLLSALTSIIPLSRAWQSGGIKWGMWNTPLFTFSRSCRRLSWSKGKAPWDEMGEDEARQKKAFHSCKLNVTSVADCFVCQKSLLNIAKGIDQHPCKYTYSLPYHKQLA